MAKDATRHGRFILQRDMPGGLFFVLTPLWAAAHLPHKGGDHIGIDYLAQLSPLKIS